MSAEYLAAHARSLVEPEAFWAEAAASITWFRRWDRVLDDSRPPFFRWFTGGLLNTCYNAVDRHVERGRGRQTAMLYDSPVTGTARAFTYADLQHEVSLLAGVLAAQDLRKGDRVLIYMPGVPEGGLRHAGLRPPRCGPLGGVWRLRVEGTGHAHRRCEAESGPDGVVRHRGNARHRLQAAARRCDRAGRAHARAVPCSSGRGAKRS